MKRILLTTLILIVVKLAVAQPMNVEGMAGNRYLFYQHLIAKKFAAQSPFGFMHITNVSNHYQKDMQKGGRPNEVMNQVYITSALNKHFTLLTGIFYNHINDIRASAGIQFALPFKSGLFVIVPRADIEHCGSVEMMSMLEYQPCITKTVKLYSRLQVMSNYGAFGHNRSYQRFRLGINLRGVQFGVAMHLDEYGKESKPHLNTGIFVRKELS